MLTIPAPTTIIPLSEEAPRDTERAVAVETGVEVAFGGVPFAVMMLSPGDLEDFAYGFSLTEGIIDGVSDMRSVSVVQGGSGWRIEAEVAPDRMHRLLARRRAMAGRTGCGVCGIEDLAALERAQPRRGGADGATIAIAAIERALTGLPERQVLGRETGATHAAAFTAADGTILLVREDVGRHNALDKLVGAVLRQGLEPAAGFVVVTSRCSFEMVEKAASLGVAAIVAISAPTSLAIVRARALDLPLVALARRDTVTVFHGRDRIAAREQS